MAAQILTLKKFARNGVRYHAHYDSKGVLVRLINKTSDETIPPESQSFRRLADNNRGNKFQAA
ncbi:MAG: hypothetical protein Q7S95_00450 [bacterium]|nr:hypothetical protein [bacterium]